MSLELLRHRLIEKSFVSLFLLILRGGRYFDSAQLRRIAIGSILPFPPKPLFPVVSALRWLCAYYVLADAAMPPFPPERILFASNNSRSRKFDVLCKEKQRIFLI